MQTIAEITSPRIKKHLNVLKPGETRRQRLWVQCVLDAKKLLDINKEIRWQVVLLAKKCCIIHHGGRVVEARYTLRRFAKDIGMKWSTFYEWYHLKNNIYDHLPEKDQKTTSFATLRHLDKDMAGTKWNAPNVQSVVRKKLKEFKHKTDTTIKMEKYLKHIKTIHFNCTNELMIKDCDKAVIGEIVHLCRGIIHAVGKYDKKR